MKIDAEKQGTTFRINEELLATYSSKTADNFNKKSLLVENNIAYGAKRKEIVPWELKPLTHIHLPEDI